MTDSVESTQCNVLVIMLAANSFCPLTDTPTRTTSDSATVIDNILFTNDSPNQSVGVLFADISDDLPIFIVTDKGKHVDTFGRHFSDGWKNLHMSGPKFRPN